MGLGSSDPIPSLPCIMLDNMDSDYIYGSICRFTVCCRLQNMRFVLCIGLPTQGDVLDYLGNWPTSFAFDSSGKEGQEESFSSLNSSFEEFSE